MHKKNKYWQLFLSTFKLSACTFGGGFVIIPLMRERFVKELHWIEEEEMLDLTAIAQSSPGSIAINASILVGYHVAGIPGALITVVGAALPPLIIISIISAFYQAFRSNKYVNYSAATKVVAKAAELCADQTKTSGKIQAIYKYVISNYSYDYELAKTVKSAVKATSIVRVMADPGKARKIKGVETLDGKGCWEEQLGDARYLASAPSFFQVNTAQAEKLAAEVVEGLGGRMGEEGPEGLDGLLVADLYAGGGTFSVPLARAGADVIAIEAAGSSVRSPGGVIFTVETTTAGPCAEPGLTPIPVMLMRKERRGRSPGRRPARPTPRRRPRRRSSG